MPAYHSESDYFSEPKQRFYPPQGMRQSSAPPSTPEQPPRYHSLKSTTGTEVRIRHPKKNGDDAAYLTHRHPILLQRLYSAADAHLNTYPSHAFIYDAYPDYLSLHLMRDRILRENASLTEEFLQEGCPIDWLRLLTDTVLTELLCRLRHTHRSPRGEASTTSVLSVSRS